MGEILHSATKCFAYRGMRIGCRFSSSRPENRPAAGHSLPTISRSKREARVSPAPARMQRRSPHARLACLRGSGGIEAWRNSGVQRLRLKRLALQAPDACGQSQQPLDVRIVEIAQRVLLADHCNDAVERMGRREPMPVSGHADRRSQDLRPIHSCLQETCRKSSRSLRAGASRHSRSRRPAAIMRSSIAAATAPSAWRDSFRLFLLPTVAALRPGAPATSSTAGRARRSSSLLR